MISLLMKRPWLTTTLLILATSPAILARDQRDHNSDKLGSTTVEPMAADARISAALRQVSAERVRANIERLVSFGTRLTISSQDSASISAGREVGAAREWIK
jgi:hypothetical protein